ncbi:MAG: TraR/DksA family transcriptional regulator [Bacteroidaceae bacterium]|nr:TraR/DksA family transcriptional regulator [Bacteroidaceae bacterium]
MEEVKKRYTDEELDEFKVLIEEKLAVARKEFNDLMRSIRGEDSNDVDDTMPTYKVLEEGSATQSKEEMMRMAARSQKFIQGLEAALMRIKNKTYGIDRMTGELIPKERLRAVPHATLSVASKLGNKNH